MNNNICCELSKKFWQKTESLSQQGLPDREFGKSLMTEFQIYLTQLTLSKSKICVECENFKIAWKNFFTNTLKEIQESEIKEKNWSCLNLHTGVADEIPDSIRQKRLVMLKKCEVEDRYLTSEEMADLDYIELICLSCRKFIMYLGKECANHFIYKCRHCGYQNKKTNKIPWLTLKKN
jgi:hypothetical protein